MWPPPPVEVITVEEVAVDSEVEEVVDEAATMPVDGSILLPWREVKGPPPPMGRSPLGRFEPVPEGDEPTTEAEVPRRCPPGTAVAVPVSPRLVSFIEARRARG